MTGRTHRRSNLAVIVLTLLAEEPMHAYCMQRLIADRGKDHVVNIAQRNSIYQTLDRLARAELVVVREVVHHEGGPDRTIYEITQQGQQVLREWMGEMLAAPAREFPEFPAALASLPVLEPAEALAHLERRIAVLAEEVATLQRRTNPELPRLLTLDDEHRQALLSAELDWVRSVVADLRSGALTWDADVLRALSARFATP